MSEVKSMDIMEILEVIPHRYPFLLIDRVTDYKPGEYAKGYKNLTMNEEFFQGHFPNNPVMPGVLQIEAMAQMSAGILMTQEHNKDKLALFAGIDNVKFKRMVRPGDRLDMECTLVKARGPIAKTRALGFVDGQPAVEADLTFALQKR